MTGAIPADARATAFRLQAIERGYLYRHVPRRYLAAYMRDAGRLSLSTLPHQKILQALEEHGCDSAAAVFEQQWRRGVAELEAWVARAPSTGRTA